MPIHVLIAAADRELAEAVGWYLEAEGRRVTIADSGAAALKVCSRVRPDAAVLDLALLGPEALAALRGASALPVLVLADREAPAIEGMDADAVVAGPCGAMELVAHLKTLLQRAGLGDKAPLASPHLRVFPDQREVAVRHQPVALTTLEFDLLVCLMRHSRVVMSRSQLADAIWGEDFYGDLRLVDNHVSRLRSKLRQAGLKPLPIVTVRGVGYVFRPEG